MYGKMVDRIRNTVQVIFMVECASHVAKKIAEGFPCHDVQYFGFQVVIPAIMAIGW